MTRKVTAAAARIPPPPAVAFGDPRGHGLLWPLAESDATRRGARQPAARGRPAVPGPPIPRHWTGRVSSRKHVPTVLPPGLLHVTSVIHR